MSDIETPTDTPDSMKFALSERPDLPENVVVGDFRKVREKTADPGENPVPAIVEPPPARFLVGDWIRFYTAEKTLAIARVEYIRQDQNGSLQLLSSMGVLPEQAVLETRRGGK